MKSQADGGLLDTLRRNLSGATRIAVIGIGDELSPVDWPGMFVAREIAAMNLPDIRVFLAETVPETMTGPVRAYRPDRLLFLDAADMGLPPGSVGIIDPETIDTGLFSTHALPLPVVMTYLEQETEATATLLGIQPGSFENRNILDGFIADIVKVLREIAGKGT